MKTNQWLAFALASLMFFLQAAPASANFTPYESYNYNYWENPTPAPAAYVPDRSWFGSELGIGDFREPTDMVVSPSGLLYVLDSGNGRIVILDEEWEVVREIGGFELEGAAQSFSNPEGMFVDANEMIYIADTENRRVVVLTKDGELVRIIENPQSDVLPANFNFVPLKITVDHAERVYVVARGMFEGIMQFDRDGQFIGYVGTNMVTLDYTDYIWRLLSTQQQRSQMALFVPTEFSNIDIDSRGFVYATNIDPGSEEPVKRLNPAGEDVLKRFGYFEVAGDILFRRAVGPSRMIDVKVLGDGMYSVLDGNQGRVFTYSDEGDLLHVFGGKGNQTGTFRIPVAIEKRGDHLMVLDRSRGNIVLFKPTKFGSIVNEAMRFHYNGYDTEAVPLWREALKLNANYDLAYIGIGKSLLREKRNQEAMAFFELGMDRESYSVAFKRHRRELMQEHFGTALSLITLLAALWAVIVLIRRRRSKQQASGSVGSSQMKEGNVHEA